MKRTIKVLLGLVVAAIILASCEAYKPLDTYTVEVEYSNGDLDTLEVISAVPPYLSDGCLKRWYDTRNDGINDLNSFLCHVRRMRIISTLSI